MSDAAERETEIDIPPALTPNEWANITKLTADALRRYVDLSQEVGRPHAAIAILNDELHDEDPRKLAREHVALLRSVAEHFATTIPELRSGASDTTVAEVAALSEQYSQLLELADVIESYLPPDRALTNPDRQ
jgi:hypothetical protein